MDEREALELLGAALPAAGDDAAVVGSTAITTDMLHESTDFPPGTTRYSAGWRSVAALRCGCLSIRRLHRSSRIGGIRQLSAKIERCGFVETLLFRHI